MKGILFLPDMAVAACEGRKTQTRRVIVPQPNGLPAGPHGAEFSVGGFDHACDYKVGERRCLLTTWVIAKLYDGVKPTAIAASIACGAETFWHAGLGTPKPDWAGKSRPGRFLPNNLRPLMPVFEIVGVRAERAREITTADAAAEGVGVDLRDGAILKTFSQLWDSINAERGYGWSVNPWVWVVAFKRLSVIQ